MKLINKTLLTFGLLATFLLVTGLALPLNKVHADAKSDVCQGVGLLDPASGNCTTSKGSASPESIVATVVNILSIVVGVIAVIMIIIGGIRFVLSGGDSNATNSARNTVLYALVGIVVVFMAQILVKFVLNKVQQ